MLLCTLHIALNSLPLLTLSLLRALLLFDHLDCFGSYQSECTPVGVFLIARLRLGVLGKKTTDNDIDITS